MSMRNFCKTSQLKLSGIFLGMLVLSGCSFLAPIKREPINNYVLNSVPTFAYEKHALHKIVLVMPPQASTLYDTSLMAYSISPYQIAYFAKNKWVIKPTEMLQELLVQTLQNTGSFRAVVTPPYHGRTDVILATQLIELRQDFMKNGSVLKITIGVQVLNSQTGALVTAKQFSQIEPTEQNTPYAGVVAANKGIAKILKQIANIF